jgi:hypothetical protein
MNRSRHRLHADSRCRALPAGPGDDGDDDDETPIGDPPDEDEDDDWDDEEDEDEEEPWQVHGAGNRFMQRAGIRPRNRDVSGAARTRPRVGSRCRRVIIAASTPANRYPQHRLRCCIAASPCGAHRGTMRALSQVRTGPRPLISDP